MKKFFTKMSLLGVLILSVTTMNAQVVWPTADTATIKASQFADTTQIYWQRTGGAAPAAGFTGWVTRGLTATAGNLDSARFVWRSDASASGGQYYTGFTFLASPSRLNGAAVFNSDFLDLKGTKSPHSGEMVSPRMNLTGYTGMVVQINQLYRNFQSQTLVSYSSDDGVTWSTPIDINSDITVNTNSPDPTDKTQTNATIKRVKLAGSVGSANFRIKFTFTGNYYFWILDDVKIYNVDYDLQMSTFYSIPPSLYTPKEQGEPVYFMADVKNTGRLPMKNVKLAVNVWRAADGAKVFTSTSTQYPATTIADTTLENRILPNALNLNSLNVGAYFGSYRVFGDSSSVDAIPANDTVRFAFVVSDTTPALSVAITGVGTSNYTKEDANIITTGNATSYWAATEAKTWRIGNYYRINKGKGKSLSSIVARLNPFIVAGKTLLGAIYEWVDANADDAIQPAERTLVAYAEIPIAANVANANNWFVFKLVDYNTSKTFQAKDSTNYLAMIEIDPGPPAATPVYPTAVFNNVYDYSPSSATFTVADSLHLRLPYTIIIGKNSTTDWQVGGYSGVHYVPCVRLNVTTFFLSDVKNLLSNDNKLTLSPNPVSGNFITADVDLVKQSEAVINIMTMDGKYLAEQVVENMQKTQVQVDISDYAAGMYIFKITTPNGIMTKRFVVTK